MPSLSLHRGMELVQKSSRFRTVRLPLNSINSQQFVAYSAQRAALHLPRLMLQALRNAQMHGIHLSAASHHEIAVRPKSVLETEQNEDEIWDGLLANSTTFLTQMANEIWDEYQAGTTIEIGNHPCAHVDQ